MGLHHQTLAFLHSLILIFDLEEMRWPRLDTLEAWTKYQLWLQQCLHIVVSSSFSSDRNWLILQKPEAWTKCFLWQCLCLVVIFSQHDSLRQVVSRYSFDSASSADARCNKVSLDLNILIHRPQPGLAFAVSPLL